MTSNAKANANKNAITLLMNDHREAEKSFAEFEKLSSGKSVGKKKALADRIGDELLKHMAIEEDIFYPEVKKNIKGAEDVVNEGIVEHASAKSLIKQILAMTGDEEFFDTKVKVLNELIEHHVGEEEDEMFPKVKKSSLDLEVLGQKMIAHKAQL